MTEKRRGAPKLDRVKEGRKIYLYADEWEYVEKWGPNGADVNNSVHISLMVDRLQRTAPDGISSQPPKSTKPAEPRIPNAVSQYAKERGISNKAALVELVNKGLKVADNG